LSSVDDLMYMAEGNDMEEANQKPQDMMECPGGALAWTSDHASSFELDKSAHIVWSKQRQRCELEGRWRWGPTPRPRPIVDGMAIPTVDSGDHNRPGTNL
jgi:hypothetical protein